MDALSLSGVLCHSVTVCNFLMRMMINRALHLILLFILSSGSNLLLGNRFEETPSFAACDILDTDLLSSPHHKVESNVSIVRYGYQFELVTDAGKETVWSEAMLAQRIQEAAAIATLAEVGQTEAFIKSLTTAAQNPIMNAYSVATRPVETIKGLPSGASRYLKGSWYRIKKTSAKVSAKTKEVASKAQEIGQSPSEGVSNVDVGELTDEAKEAASDASKEHLGYNNAKRTWAKRLNVDPYSDNPDLQEALERIAWATSLGSFAADTAIPSVTALNYAGDIKSAVYETPPIQLEQQNNERLKACGIDPESISAFHNHKQFKITSKTAIAMVVENLSETKGISKLIETALGAEDHSESTMILKIAVILDKYHDDVSPLIEIEIRRGMITAIDSEERMILPIAVDYLYWTPTASEVANDEELDHPDREVRLTGKISSNAWEALDNLGWKVIENCLDL